ncbi:MAG: hypothetical protein NZM43_05135 [Saprospiraceae bacterium]|nr:hypothetical protein [Saprospiraceae bacterium]MDW8483692.1 SO2930 family diheme c-type cytochrome [Saprospiraceae bacterium]
MTALCRSCPDRNKLAAVFILLLSSILTAFSLREVPFKPEERLSAYGFFLGPLANLQPAENVFSYEVNAPLFSDYAEKARFVALPQGKRMRFRLGEPFDLPEGSVIIKNFFYYHDFRRPEEGRRLVETRLLVREADTWKALTYVWNAEQTDAFLEVAGAEIPLTWIDNTGKRQRLSYQVPNLNQCKGCHATKGQLVPIGLTAEQTHRKVSGASQLERWMTEGLLEGVTAAELAAVTPLADYDDPTSSLESRARAYLHANCAHCHHPHGSANTSGLFLEITQTDPLRLGVLKPPVAAGRGSGNRKYSITPGKPSESILLYRMEQNDPGIRMPELGRQLAHREGIELIRQWILQMAS